MPKASRSELTSSASPSETAPSISAKFSQRHDPLKVKSDGKSHQKLHHKKGGVKKLSNRPSIQITYEGEQEAVEVDDEDDETNANHAQESVDNSQPHTVTIKQEVDDQLEHPQPKAGPSAPSIQETRPASDTAPSFLIVAGSYEKNLYGLEATFNASQADSSSPSPWNISLTPTFIFPAHISCIKAVAASPLGGKWLATGSDDEIVKVWDLKRRKEIGGLAQHVGSITSLTFPTRSHLLSASEDSTISLFRTRDWVLLRTLKGHSGRINWVDVHPSGKVALSVGKDKTLKMWDLMRGRGAASLALGVEAEVVRFSKSGRFFGVLSPKGIEVYSIKMDHLSSITHPKRLRDLVFAQIDDQEIIITGTEDGKLLVYTVQGKKGKTQQVASFGGHSNRIKSIGYIAIPRPSATAHLVTTVSSDGKINVYDINSMPEEGEEGGPIASYDTNGSRLVCCTVASTEPMNKVFQQPHALKKEEVAAAPGHPADSDDEDMYGDEPFAGDAPSEGEEEEEEEEEDEEEEEVEEEEEE